ncbi:EAL domain-containing protein [Alteromonas sp. 5E99-2]|uniref:EAL domain-containing protein n=1 Tax=Alteromonas sp. 5E99-2 TaxID=2817683 RepID=UPI001A9886FB|nr:EAL domain-containing protein [Alteromonas sp. 5E99-2]MBO1255890.1 EAL domain-containing protein [Alteromonas sp. 5E99-2]
MRAQHVVYGLIIALFWSTFAFSQDEHSNTPLASVVIDDNFESLNVTNTALRVYAAEGVAFSSVQAHIHQWLPIVSLSPLPSDAKIWVKLTVTHSGQHNNNLTLLVSSAHASKVEGYVVEPQRSIRRIYNDNDKHLNGHPIEFSLYPGETIDIFVGVESTGTAYLPLSLWKTSELVKHNDDHNTQLNIFTGVIACLSSYFLFSYFLRRNAARFWFTITCVGVLLFLFQFTQLTRYDLNLWIGLNQLPFICIALALYSGAKITRNLLPRTSILLRYISYSLPLIGLTFTLLCNSYTCWIISIAIVLMWLGLQLYLCVVYRDRRLLLPAWLYGSGLSVLGITFITYIWCFVIETPPYGNLFLFAIFAITTGLILCGSAIEISEHGIHIREFSHQEKRIANLRQFYDLFKASAEGLYTASLDGKLLSVNAAMCQLFGYSNEHSMLEQSSGTPSFFANREDQELLLQEILEKKSVLGREFTGKRRDGSEFWFSISCQVQGTESREFLYGSIVDITEKKQSSLNLEYLATHDSLTGILNRREFERQLQQLLAGNADSTEINLLYIDLDRFKLINDVCGHESGDELLKNIAKLISEIAGNKNKLARLGGDEFVILCDSIDINSTSLLAEKLLHGIKNYRYFCSNRFFTLSASIGYLHTIDVSLSPEQMISMADAACFIAKEQGRNQIHQYSPNDKSVRRYESELSCLEKINNAIQSDEFILYCQPYRPLDKVTDQLYIEILLRMHDEEYGVLPPSEFLPTAERYNLGVKIDQWVIENTLNWLSNNPDILDNLARCNINLSGQSLANKGLKSAILEVFNKTNIPFNKVCFEITETMAVIQLEETLDFIKTFQDLGCYFALDDFGSGFSSYSYLKNLPVDCIKIDGAFVQELLNNPINQAMVKSIHDIASVMKMTTVAEFVEDDATLIQLGKLGINYAQGYAVSKPFPLEDLVSEI